ncbi:FtsX-like permease family protein, partial [Sphingomonas bacterium]|uniref:FtsX-like permease family protein n=1 Tax=Sphingomonas bacterium TaxID=1895847 RepID=UPI00157764E3
MLTSLYRSLTRHRLFAALNIGGLALGIATFGILTLFVRWERGWDRWLPGADRLWIVQQTFHFPGAPPEPIDLTMPALLDDLRAELPGTRGVRVMPVTASVRHEGVATREKLSLVDPQLFFLFGQRFVAGDPRDALARPDGLVLARKVADRYFAPGRALGGSLDLSINGAILRYHVTGIIADSSGDTSLPMTMAAPLDASRFPQPDGDNWAHPQVYTVLRLPDQAAASAVERRLPALVTRHGRALGPDPARIVTLSLRPLTGLHLQRATERAIVTTLGIVGLLALALAIVNYVNLATAQAGTRAREVALRKAVGATRAALIAQFTGEAVATAALATLIGLALAELAMPFVNAASGASLAIVYVGRDSILPAAALLALSVGVIAGVHPALLLSRFRPAAVLAAARAPGGGRAGSRMRQVLVTGQFTVAIALSIGTAVILAQARHLERADLGFRRDGVILVTSFNDPALGDRRDRLRAALGTLPGVTSVTVSDDAPAFRIAQSLGEIGRSAMTAPLPTAHLVSVGPGFFDTYRPRLLAGRFPDDAHAADAVRGDDPATLASAEHGVAVTRGTTAALGFASPDRAIGQIFQLSHAAPLRIIGVIDDLHFGSPREAVTNTVLFYHPDGPPIQILALRFINVDDRQVLAAAATAWRRIAPAVPFEARTAAAQLFNEYYRADAQRSRLFTIGAVLAVVIGCIGLYGLAAFDTARRVKEIGIRKTLGASTGDVLRLLVGQFLRPVLVANLLAWPIAFVAMRRWLSGFDDRVALSPLFFVGASAAAVLIAAATVAGQA